MERVPDRPDDQPETDADEYPAGTESPTETPGVDPAEGGDAVPPGQIDDPPQVD